MMKNKKKWVRYLEDQTGDTNIVSIIIVAVVGIAAVLLFRPFIITLFQIFF